MKPLFFAAALVLATTPAFAQPATPDKTYTSAADIQALIAKAKTETPKQVISENILALAPYRVNLEYRSMKGAAAIHDTEAEMMYVIDGSGSITTGGTIPDVKRTNPTNQSGTDITGGTTQAVTKGDFLIVPEGVPHLIVPASGVTLVLMTFHVPRPPAK